MQAPFDRDALVDALRRLAEEPGTRIREAPDDDALAVAFNALARRLETAREGARRHDELRHELQAITDALLDVANGSFASRVPRSHSGDTLDVLAFLVNSTADELQELVGTLARERDRLESTQHQLIAKEKEAALGRLAAGIAHEVNQPLTVIMGLLDMLRRRSDVAAERREHCLELMNDATSHIAQIVDSVRTFGRPTPFELRPTEPLLPVQRALDLVGPELRALEISLTVNHPHGLPAIMANAERLQQVFINLLINARDALGARETPQPRIVIDVHGERDALVYRVADNGPGVDPADRPRLFEPFFTTKLAEGTGLGLSLSRGIVRDHGGSLTYEVGDDGGSVLHVRIPLPGGT